MTSVSSVVSPGLSPGSVSSLLSDETVRVTSYELDSCFSSRVHGEVDDGHFIACGEVLCHGRILDFAGYVEDVEEFGRLYLYVESCCRVESEVWLVGC